MDIFKTIYGWLEKLLEPIHDFIVANHSNPFLWIGIFIGGITLFLYVYDRLRKEG